MNWGTTDSVSGLVRWDQKRLQLVRAAVHLTKIISVITNKVHKILT